MDELPQFSSITVSTADYGVMYCLGALRMWATRGIRDPKRRPQNRTQHCEEGRFEAVFFFATDEMESLFLTKAKELLPEEKWKWAKLDEHP